MFFWKKPAKPKPLHPLIHLAILAIACLPLWRDPVQSARALKFINQLRTLVLDHYVEVANQILTGVNRACGLVLMGISPLAATLSYVMHVRGWATFSLIMLTVCLVSGIAGLFFYAQARGWIGGLLLPKQPSTLILPSPADTNCPEPASSVATTQKA